MILASASPRRLQLLRDVGLSPIVRPADIDETPLPDENPRDMVLRLASRKAEACRRALPADLVGQTVVAADTTVWFRGIDLGKPRDPEDAVRMLRMLSGRTHHVSTGVCVLSPQGTRAFAETSDVTFYDLTDAQIEAYVKSGEPLDKAGAYGIQGLGRILVSEIRGDFFNIVGLPVARLARTLDELAPAGEGNSPMLGMLGGDHE